jgi:hypothetical protein
MEARKKVLGEEHEGTLSSMVLAGAAYRLGGRWEDAEKLQVQTMEMCKTKLGADHPSLYADQHGQPSGSIRETRPMGRCREAASVGDGDEQDEARRRPS